jgi:hypothetical protein
VDSDVAETGQPYAFTGDDPLNETDPLGLTAGPARPPKSVCANAHHKRTCETAVKKEEACGRLGCKDAKEAHKALPEAIGVGLFVSTGGIGDLIEALGGAEEAGDAAAGNVLRHYTTSEAAEAISKAGSIEPSASSGVSFVTPDVYAGGAEAQSMLALPNTPDGFFEFPSSSVLEPSPASTVGEANGFLGGGTEITTSYPIDVSGIGFTPFG